MLQDTYLVTLLPAYYKRRILVHLGERPFNTADGIEAMPAMHFAQEVLAGRI